MASRKYFGEMGIHRFRTISSTYQ